ncbi:MAG TPA: class I SAM-dependent methyltransferase [Gammaproteobacteria bacterium]|nr:class I SAM-dependent methyltransferase [Gammaproteobacteria bacterium]
MAEHKKMSSRELGLLLGRQLLGVQDLHYGLWDQGLELTLANLPHAQQRYTEYLFEALPPPDHHPRVLDVGCGTGYQLQQLLERGYRADGLVPSAELATQVRERLAAYPRARLFECRLQDLPLEAHAGAWDILLFSESFQYIPLADSLRAIEALLAPGGYAVICDFFRRQADSDGLFGGGHQLAHFYRVLEQHPLRLERDIDMTEGISPSIALLDQLLMQRLLPAGRSLDIYLRDNRPWSWALLRGLARLLAGRKLRRLREKYFSGHRTRATFEARKTYRLLVLVARPDI